MENTHPARGAQEASTRVGVRRTHSGQIRACAPLTALTCAHTPVSSAAPTRIRAPVCTLAPTCQGPARASSCDHLPSGTPERAAHSRAARGKSGCLGAGPVPTRGFLPPSCLRSPPAPGASSVLLLVEECSRCQVRQALAPSASLDPRRLAGPRLSPWAVTAAFLRSPRGSGPHAAFRGPCPLTVAGTVIPGAGPGMKQGLFLETTVCSTRQTRQEGTVPGPPWSPCSHTEGSATAPEANTHRVWARSAWLPWVLHHGPPVSALGFAADGGPSTGQVDLGPLVSRGRCWTLGAVKTPPAVRETWVRSLGWEDPLEKGKASHSSVLAWRILQSTGSQRVGHDGAALTHSCFRTT